MRMIVILEHSRNFLDDVAVRRISHTPPSSELRVFSRNAQKTQRHDDRLARAEAKHVV